MVRRAPGFDVPGARSDDRHPIAFVTPRFPPMRGSGVYRVEAVMRFLPEHGFDPRVVTIPNAWMSRQADDDYSGVEVPGLQPTSPADRLMRGLSRVRYLRWAQRELLVPDVLLAWAHSVARQAPRALGDVRLVYGTAPPFSGVVAAGLLARRLGVPWVQELRDPPSFDRGLYARTGWHRRRMLRFERRYMREPDQVITVTPRMRLRLLELHGELDPRRVHVVTNGYPEIEVDPALSGRRPGRFTITYVGSFQGSVRRRGDSLFTPAILIPALDRIPADMVSVRVVGPVSEEQRRTVVGLDTRGIVELVGSVGRPQAVAEIATADVAVILAEEGDWWIGRKAFEYLRFAHTILAIVVPGDTTDLLSRHPRAVFVAPSEVFRLPRILESQYQEWRAGNWPRGPVPDAIQTDETCVAGVARVLHAALNGLDYPSKI